MHENIIKFDDTKIGNCKFNQHKSLISINNVGINKIVAYNKAPFGKPDVKYFIGY